MRRVTLGHDERIIATFWAPTWLGVLIGKTYLRIMGWRHG